MAGTAQGIQNRNALQDMNLTYGAVRDSLGQPLDYQGTMQATGSDGKIYHRQVRYFSDLSPQQMDDFIYKERAKKVLYSMLVLAIIAMIGILLAKYAFKLI